MNLVDAKTMADIDSKAQELYGYPSALLMEDAGLLAWLELRRSVWNGALPEGHALFVAGKGNNGGDALVMARRCYLDGKRDLSILLAKEDLAGDPAVMLGICRSLGIEIFVWEREREAAERKIAGAGWVFDGLAGTGISGELRSPLADICAAMDASPARVVAIDVPSGIGDAFRTGFRTVRADVTVTMGLPKQSLYTPAARPFCGRITVIPLGFPPQLTGDPSWPISVLEDRDLEPLVPPLPPDVYKNRRGVLAVFAGSVGTTGAAALCSEAALRCRGGLVTLFIDSEAWSPLAASLTSVMVRPAPEDIGVVDLPPYTGFLVGSGWGTGAEREAPLRHLVEAGTPGVLDADGITILGRLMERGEAPDLGGRWVLTPHPGEFRRISGAGKDDVLARPLPHLLDACRKLDAVVVLKGHVTWIGSPTGEAAVVDGMTPALATGGTGDVLAGLIGAFLAGGMAPFDAARAGVLLQLRVGRKAFAERGWFSSEDLLPYVSREAGALQP